MHLQRFVIMSASCVEVKKVVKKQETIFNETEKSDVSAVKTEKVNIGRGLKRNREPCPDYESISNISKYDIEKDTSIVGLRALLLCI